MTARGLHTGDERLAEELRHAAIRAVAVVLLAGVLTLLAWLLAG